MPYKDPDIARAKHTERQRKRRQADKEKTAADQRAYRAANREVVLANKRRYYEENKVKLQADQRGRLASNLARHKVRYNTEPSYRLSCLLRARINMALRNKAKSGSAVSDLGCSVDEFKTYIENKFATGMSWDNHGEWHLDHIQPLASFDLTDRQQFLVACHYSNYQPLWKIDNMKKGARV